MIDISTFLSESNRLADIWPDVRTWTRNRTVAAIGSQKLIYFQSENRKFSEPVFIVPSLISHAYILDLLPGKSLVEYLTLKGFDVYLLEWGHPETYEQHITFASIIKNRLPYFVNEVLKNSQAEKLHLFGHCLGGTLTSIYASHSAEKIQSLLLMTSPLDFSAEGKFKYWIDVSPLNFKKLVEAAGNIPWPLLHSTFLSLKPMAQYQRLKRYFKTPMTDEQKKNYWAMELWCHDSVAMRGNFFKKLIYDLYKDNKLTSNKFKLEDGTPIELSRINIPILSLSSKEDNIVPHGAALMTKDLVPECPSFTHIEFRGGHVGCLSNKKSQETIWPQISNWLEGYSHEESTEIV